MREKKVENVGAYTVKKRNIIYFVEIFPDNKKRSHCIVCDIYILDTGISFTRYFRTLLWRFSAPSRVKWAHTRPLALFYSQFEVIKVGLNFNTIFRMMSREGGIFFNGFTRLGGMQFCIRITCASVVGVNFRGTTINLHPPPPPPLLS